MGRPSYDNLISAAKNVLRALSGIEETSCCLVGGMAVTLWGVDRGVNVNESVSSLRASD
jgi:hypothetical protein